MACKTAVLLSLGTGGLLLVWSRSFSPPGERGTTCMVLGMIGSLVWARGSSAVGWSWSLAVCFAEAHTWNHSGQGLQGWSRVEGTVHRSNLLPPPPSPWVGRLVEGLAGAKGPYKAEDPWCSVE